MQETPRIVMVYNADGGLLRMVYDALHKVIAPQSYPCSLCALSYGPVSMRSKWRRYLRSLPLDVLLLHRDEFHNRYGERGIALPVILAEREGERLDLLVSNAQLDALGDVDELIAATENALVQAALESAA